MVRRPPQLVCGAGDDLGQGLGPADEQRDELVGDLAIRQRAPTSLEIGDVERQQAVERVDGPVVGSLAARGHEVDHEPVERPAGGVARAPEAGSALLTSDVAVHDRGELGRVLDREPELVGGDTGGDERRVVVANVEHVAAGELVETRTSQRAHRRFERADRAGPEGGEHGASQARVERRVDHGEARHRPERRRRGRPVVVAQEARAREHRSLDDGEPPAVREHLPHVVETSEGPRVVLRQRVGAVRRAQLSVDRVGIAHHVRGERVVGDRRLHAPNVVPTARPGALLGSGRR